MLMLAEKARNDGYLMCANERIDNAYEHIVKTLGNVRNLLDLSASACLGKHGKRKESLRQYYLCNSTWWKFSSHHFLCA